MKISHPYFAGSSTKRVIRPQTESINSRSDTSSQSSILLGQSQEVESAQGLLILNHSDAFHSPRAPFPTTQNQQPKTLQTFTYNGRHLLQEEKRPSRHEQFKQIQTSELTDDEFESANPVLRKRAKARMKYRLLAPKYTQKARTLTGNSNAKASDLAKTRRKKLAEKLTGDSNATTAVYVKIKNDALAQKLSGDLNARAAYYDRINREKWARIFTGDPNAPATAYNSTNREEWRARELASQREKRARIYANDSNAPAAD